MSCETSGNPKQIAGDFCFWIWQQPYLLLKYTCSHHYKHCTSRCPEGFQRPATPLIPSAAQPLGGTMVGDKEGVQRLASSEPTHLSLALFCAPSLSISLVLASNSQPDASPKGTAMASSLVPLSGYRMQASSVSNPISIRGPLDGHWNN